jgi:hypothetical protein
MWPCAVEVLDVTVCWWCWGVLVSCVCLSAWQSVTADASLYVGEDVLRALTPNEVSENARWHCERRSLREPPVIAVYGCRDGISRT